MEVIGTMYEIQNGIFTGKIIGENCHGLKKKTIVSELIKDNNYIVSFGYGNNNSDNYFLSLLDMHYNMILTTKNVAHIIEKNDKYLNNEKKHS